jgi:alpha-glucosidase
MLKERIMLITVGTLGPLREVIQERGDVVFSFESSDLVLTPIMPNVVRHTWVPTHWRLYTQAAKDGYAVHRRYWPAGSAEVTETSDTVRIATGEMIIEATRDPFHLRYLTADGKTFLEEMTEGGLSWSYWQYALSYQLGEQDHFYGLGQINQLHDRVDLDQRGSRHEIWNQHSPPAATIFPLILSLRGYGLLIDNACKATWDLGCSDPTTFSYQAEGGGLQYYVVQGSDLRHLLHTFAKLTGAAPLPPRWVFGLLQSRYGYRNRDELEEIAQTFRRKGLPCDGLILDVFWFKEMGDLAFHPFDWPNAREMIARLREQGFRIIVIEEPYLTLKSRNYSEALERGYLAKHYDGSAYSFDFWPGECALVDFSNPAARRWWGEKHKPLLDLGVSGWWTDLNEPTKHFQDMTHHAGPASAVHNLNALFMQEALFDAHNQYASERRLFILSRSAFPGSQRYGTALWSGDVDMTFASLRKQLAVGLNTGMAGFLLWGTDIGGFGFGGKCTAELYARWFQFGAFSPLCRPHGDQSELREPWAFGREIEAICGKYLRLRYRLLPYIYTAAYEAYAAGVPIMRPLVLEFPDDPTVLNLSDEYLFGPDILVAPVLEENCDERRVYLPVGNWTDFWTDKQYGGPCSIDVPAPLETLPLFIRDGAILPMGPEMQYSGELPLDPLTLEIYRGVNRTFVLYEDDQETVAYKQGAASLMRIETLQEPGVLTCHLGSPQERFTGFCAERTIILNIHHQNSVHEVVYDEALIPPLANDQIDSVPSGWWWNADRNIATIKLQHVGKTSLVRIVTAARD